MARRMTAEEIDRRNREEDAAIIASWRRIIDTRASGDGVIDQARTRYRV